LRNMQNVTFQKFQFPYLDLRHASSMSWHAIRCNRMKKKISSFYDNHRIILFSEISFYDSILNKIIFKLNNIKSLRSIARIHSTRNMSYTALLITHTFSSCDCNLLFCGLYQELPLIHTANNSCIDKCVF
jgi:hypothetical protein